LQTIGLRFSWVDDSDVESYCSATEALSFVEPLAVKLKAMMATEARLFAPARCLRVRMFPCLLHIDLSTKTVAFVDMSTRDCLPCPSCSGVFDDYL
jgi:hypothetical protein